MNFKKTKVKMLTEYRDNPVGISCHSPRFSWIVEDSLSVKQTALHLIVADNIKDIDNNIGNMWDTEKIYTDCSVNFAYKGEELSYPQIYYWKIKIWDENDESWGFSNYKTFETGITELDVKWIVPSQIQNTRAPLFRKEFLIEKEIVRARCYIVGLGYYELRMNGKKVDDNILHPGWTDTSKTLLCTTHDVTDHIKLGKNAIGIMLCSAWNRDIRFALKTIISYADSTTEVIASDIDNGWYYSAFSPILKASIYDGETYDAREEQQGWDSPDFIMDETGWKKVIHGEPPTGILMDHSLEPIKIMDYIKDIVCIKDENNKKVYDVGQNISGYLHVELKGERGSKVVLRHSENVYGDNSLNTETLRNATATDTYILSGIGTEIYEPRFTYHGFRYFEVTAEETTEISDIKVCVVRSSVAITGDFSCGDSLLNRIQKAVVMTESDNLHGIPTDCPQRDERLGWLNDMTVRAEQAMYNFDMSRFYKKWLQDIRDTQGEHTGAIADTAPFIRYGAQPADPVCSSYIMLPFLMNKHYSDENVLREFYDGMAAWENYLLSVSEDYIVDYSYYGDWASPATVSDSESIGAGAISSITPGDYVSTAYLYLNAVILKKAAIILNKKSEADYYEKLSCNIKKSFVGRYFDEQSLNFSTGSQAANTLAVHFELVDEKHKAKVVENIVDNIIKNNCSLTTGNQCTKYIYEVLTKNGYVDLAFKLTTRTDYPGIGYMLENGATTIWERWENITGGGMNSHNHPMHGSFTSWFYKMLAGINLSQDGHDINHILIKPYLPKELSCAKGVYDSVKGTIISGWEKTAELTTYNFTIPWNTTARICLPLPQNSSIQIIKNSMEIALDASLQIAKGRLSGNVSAGEYIVNVR